MTTFAVFTSWRRTFSMYPPTWSLWPSTLLHRICSGERGSPALKRSTRARASSASLLLCEMKTSKSESGISRLVADRLLCLDSVEKASGKLMREPLLRHALSQDFIKQVLPGTSRYGLQSPCGVVQEAHPMRPSHSKAFAKISACSVASSRA